MTVSSSPNSPTDIRNVSLRDRLSEGYDDFSEKSISSARKFSLDDISPRNWEHSGSLVETRSAFESAVTEFFSEVAPEMVEKGSPISVLQRFFLLKLRRMFGKRVGAMERLAQMKALIGNPGSVTIDRNELAKTQLRMQHEQEVSAPREGMQEKKMSFIDRNEFFVQLGRQHEKQTSTFRAGMQEHRRKLAKVLINRMRMGKVGNLFSLWCSAHQRRKLALVVKEFDEAKQEHEEEWDLVHERMEAETEENEARETEQMHRIQQLTRETEALKIKVDVKNKVHSSSDEDWEELFSRMEEEADQHEARAAADQARIGKLSKQVALLQYMLAAAKTSGAVPGASSSPVAVAAPPAPPSAQRSEPVRRQAPTQEQAEAIQNQVLEAQMRANGAKLAIQLEGEERQRFEDEQLEVIKNQALEAQMRAAGVRLAIQLQEQERQSFEDKMNAAKAESALHRQQAVQLARVLKTAQVTLHAEERLAALEETNAIRNTSVMQAKLGALRAKKEARASKKATAAASKSPKVAAARSSSRRPSRVASRRASRRSSLRGSKKVSRTGSPDRRNSRLTRAAAATCSPPAPKYNAPHPPPPALFYQCSS